MRYRCETVRSRSKKKRRKRRDTFSGIIGREFLSALITSAGSEPSSRETAVKVVSNIHEGTYLGGFDGFFRRLNAPPFGGALPRSRSRAERVDNFAGEEVNRPITRVCGRLPLFSAAAPLRYMLSSPLLPPPDQTCRARAVSAREIFTRGRIMRRPGCSSRRHHTARPRVVPPHGLTTEREATASSSRCAHLSSRERNRKQRVILRHAADA